MKRKLLTALVILVSFAFTACESDPAMDDLILDTQSIMEDSGSDPVGNNGNGGNGSGDNGSGGGSDDPPGGN